MDRETLKGDTPHAHDGAGDAMAASLRSLEHPRTRAGHYRSRAEELRSIADEVMLVETQRTLLSLADSYDHMAAMLEDASPSR
jgi:hypothetical protein